MKPLIESLTLDKQLNEEQIEALESELNETQVKNDALERDCAELRNSAVQTKDSWLASLDPCPN